MLNHELPMQCPGCRAPFNPLIPREREFSPVAKGTFLLGCIASFLTTCIVCFFFLVILPVSGVPFPRTGRAALVVSGVMLVISLAPGFWLGSWAYRMPRVVRIRCYQCGFKEVYFVDGSGE